LQGSQRSLVTESLVESAKSSEKPPEEKQCPDEAAICLEKWKREEEEAAKALESAAKGSASTVHSSAMGDSAAKEPTARESPVMNAETAESFGDSTAAVRDSAVGDSLLMNSQPGEFHTDESQAGESGAVGSTVGRPSEAEPGSN